MDLRKKVTWNRVYQIWYWYNVFFIHGPIDSIFCFAIFKTDLHRRVTYIWTHRIYCCYEVFSNTIQQETIEKIIMKSGPSNMVLIISGPYLKDLISWEFFIYSITRFIRRQPKMFKETFDKSKMKPDPSYMIPVCSIYKHGLIGDNQECLKRTFEESHMKSGPPNMVLVCLFY